MDDLKTAFGGMGFSGVKTYIQSGNVVFSSGEKDKARLARLIEKKLFQRYAAELRTAIVSFGELKQIVAEATEGFGAEPESFRYDVWFLIEPLDAGEVLRSVNPREGVDTISGGKGVVYVSRPISLAGKSRLLRITQLPIYKNITIRNWNTTVKLFQLMQTGEK